MAPLSAWWAIPDATPKRIVVVGDSVPGWNGDGTTNWVWRLRASLAARWGNGGDGYFLPTRPEFVRTGTWTQAVNADAWDSAPWGDAYTANGAANVGTWTKPAGSTVASFDLYYIDGAGAGQWSYRIDGGAWTNPTLTNAGANLLRKVTVNSPVTSTIERRAANAAGTAATVYFAGIRTRTATPGLVIDALAYSGNWLHVFVQREYAQWWTLDGTPDLVILNQSNDAIDLFATPANWQSDLDALFALPAGSLLVFCDGEQSNMSGQRQPSNQYGWRELGKNRVKVAGGGWLDMFQFWGDYATAAAAGKWVTDAGVHPSDAGYLDMHDRISAVLTTPRLGAKRRAA